MELYLIGGGSDRVQLSKLMKPFCDEIEARGNSKVATIFVGETMEELKEDFEDFKVTFMGNGIKEEDILPILLTEEGVLTYDRLVELNPSGIFIGGGLTPLYHKVLMKDKTWLNYINEKEVPVAGFSAGAAIIPKKAIIGGYMIENDGKMVQVLHEDCAENLDIITVVEGLGLFDYSVENHATQWGNLTRLMFALKERKTSEVAFAIDEQTMIKVKDGKGEIFGTGFVYRVTLKEGQTEEMKIYCQGQVIDMQ